MVEKATYAIAAEIVAAYVSNNSVRASDLPALLVEVSRAVSGLSAEPKQQPAAPAISPKKSVTRQYLICLEDGLRFKSLKRHLRNKFNMSPEEYRKKWNLPPDYPMVAPAYSNARSAIALEFGLGRKRRSARTGPRRKPVGAAATV